jgi:hypothetical protein
MTLYTDAHYMSSSLAKLTIGNIVIAVTRCSKRFPNSGTDKVERKTYSVGRKAEMN